MRRSPPARPTRPFGSAAPAHIPLAPPGLTTAVELERVLAEKMARRARPEGANSRFMMQPGDIQLIDIVHSPAAPTDKPKKA